MLEWPSRAEVDHLKPEGRRRAAQRAAWSPSRLFHALRLGAPAICSTGRSGRPRSIRTPSTRERDWQHALWRRSSRFRRWTRRAARWVETLAANHRVTGGRYVLAMRKALCSTGAQFPRPQATPGNTGVRWTIYVDVFDEIDVVREKRGS